MPITLLSSFLVGYAFTPLLERVDHNIVPTQALITQETEQAAASFQLLQTFQPFGSHTANQLNSVADGLCYIPASIANIALSMDNQYLAVGGHAHNLERHCAGDGSQLTLWNLQTGEKIAHLIEDGWTYNDPPGTIPLANEVDVIVGERATGFVFLPESSILVASLADSTVRLWHPETGASLGEWPGHTMSVWAIAASSDGRTVATGSADQTIRVRTINPTTGAILDEQVLQETASVQHVRLSDDGQTLVSILGATLTDTTVHLWQQEHGVWQRVGWEQVFPWEDPFSDGLFATEYHPTVAPRIQLSPDGNTVITGHLDGIIRLWDSASGVRQLSLDNHQGPIRSLAVSPDSQFLASNADGVIKLWNLATGQLIRTIETSGEPSFSMNGQILIVQQHDQAELWNWRSPTLLSTLDSSDVTLNADNTLALSSRNETLEVWYCCQ